MRFAQQWLENEPTNGPRNDFVQAEIPVNPE